MTSNPRVSVVMPVWNAVRFLRPAMDSILTQSFESFEVVVVDDGSSDGTGVILSEYRDPRVRVVRKEKRHGVVSALNLGLDLARGEFVARMDADDVSHPERFAAQVRFLDGEIDVALVGSWANVIDEKGGIVSIIRVPTDRGDIHGELLDRNVFVHSSVMFRRDRVREVGCYQKIRASDDTAQDYDLWLRLADRFPLANLPEVLVDYRIHSAQVSMRRLPAQRRCADLARQMAARRRAEHGEPRRTPRGLRLAERLRGERGTLGGDYLSLCDLYRTAGEGGIALRLAGRAVLRSPFSRQAWHLAWGELARRVLAAKGLGLVRAWLARDR